MEAAEREAKQAAERAARRQAWVEKREALAAREAELREQQAHAEEVWRQEEVVRSHTGCISAAITCMGWGLDAGFNIRAPRGTRPHVPPGVCTGFQSGICLCVSSCVIASVGEVQGKPCMCPLLEKLIHSDSHM